MRSQGKGATHRFLAIDQGDGDGTLVAWRATRTLEDLRGHLFVGAIDDHGFKPLAAEFADCGLGISASFHADFQVAQHATKHADNLFI
jgi:hypothetical protein